MKPKQSAVFIVVTLIFMVVNQGWAEKKKPSVVQIMKHKLDKMKDVEKF